MATKKVNTPVEETNKIGIKENLFDLTKDDEETSRMMYSGKIIKCLVALYHTYNDLHTIVPYTKSTFVFPEREIGIDKLKGVVSMIVNSPIREEFRIITTNQNIIMDMVDCCVRVLTQKGEIVRSPIKTFAANIHDIRYSLLENEAPQLSKAEMTESHSKINAVISKINKSKGFTKEEAAIVANEVALIGEPVIRMKLLEMLRDKTKR
jgi:hypothetical protein